MSAGAPKELRSLTGLRAVAALFVFCFHTSGYGDRVSNFWRIADVGFCGVSFFFILSGLVLTWATNPRISSRRFYGRRFARIYPAHVVMSVIAIVLYLHWEPKAEPLGYVLLSVVLLQAWIPSVVALQAGNGVSWSLSCEAFFYACFPFLRSVLTRWSPRARIQLGVGLAVASTVAALISGLTMNGTYDLVVYENPLVRASEFVLGMIVGLALREGYRPAIRPFYGWLLLAFTWGASLLIGGTRGWLPYRGITDALVLPAFLLLIVAYAGADLRGAATFFARPVMVYLGRISFAFYLVHQVALGVVQHEIQWADSGAGSAALRLLADLSVSFVAAIVLHHLVELPAQRLLTARSRSTTITLDADVTPAAATAREAEHSAR
jgi:peptidoglycan/LPS O-acetylase OafA/YrhL